MSVKDFEQGMVAGAKPYEEVYKKQKEALRRVSEELGNKLDAIDNVMNGLIEDMNDIKRKELYDLNAPPIDLKSFEQEEKEYLVAGLYTLAAQCKSPDTSPFQKAFIRSIKSYLGIQTVQITIDLSKISSIDSTKKQMAIMQTFMEYLFLEKEDFTFLTEYADFFADFSVNEKDRETILQSINNIYKAVDSLGFIEKYGFVPETPEEESNTSVELEDLVIDSILHIPSGQEKKFYGKRFSITADIHCEGELVFENCVIVYDFNRNERKITIGETGSIKILQCTVIGTCKGNLTGEWNYFIETSVL